MTLIRWQRIKGLIPSPSESLTQTNMIKVRLSGFGHQKHERAPRSDAIHHLPSTFRVNSTASASEETYLENRLIVR